jgi:rubrerythrin
MILEDVVEARAYQHKESIENESLDGPVSTILEDAAEESKNHRHRLESLIDKFEVNFGDKAEIKKLVAERYQSEINFEGILHDQLRSEKTAYRFYDNLISDIESSETTFSIERDQLLSVLREIRQEEKDGVEELKELIEAR